MYLYVLFMYRNTINFLCRTDIFCFCFLMRKFKPTRQESYSSCLEKNHQNYYRIATRSLNAWSLTGISSRFSFSSNTTILIQVLPIKSVNKNIRGRPWLFYLPCQHYSDLKRILWLLGVVIWLNLIQSVVHQAH